MQLGRKNCVIVYHWKADDKERRFTAGSFECYDAFWEKGGRLELLILIVYTDFNIFVELVYFIFTFYNFGELFWVINQCWKVEPSLLS